MNVGIAISVIREAIMLVLMISGIMILPSFIVTLLISVFQATTQIQEQTLTFIPKVVITMLLAMFLGPYIVSTLSNFWLSVLALVISV